MKRSPVAYFAVCCAGLALLGVGCAGRTPAPPAADETELAARAAYRGLAESMDIDTSPLAGRVIVIDPGHGGGFHGSAGRHGLTEADVNLAVSLFLWGLLDEAGARVALTRSADRDFIDAGLEAPQTLPLADEPPIAHAAPARLPADSLASDLRARTAVANGAAPDLFVSVHHNAAADGDTTRNQTQTYYRMSDAGPSRDAAQAIHRHLMANLGTASGRVLPGNYFVLRESTAGAAVLGEASFLTNPVFEKKLRYIDRVELEATAYFLGILDYFSGGVARVAALAPADTVLDARDVEVRATCVGATIDPASVRLTIDDAPLVARRATSVTDTTSRAPRHAAADDTTTAVATRATAPAGATTRARPATSVADSTTWVARSPGPLAGGTHTIRFEARCLSGNAVPAREATFEIRRPPASLAVETHPAWNGRDWPGVLAVTVAARDRFGLPVADGTELALEAPVEATAATRDGRAWFYLKGGSGATAADSWHIVTGTLETRTPVATPEAEAAISGFLRDPARTPISGGLVESSTGEALGNVNVDGFFAVPARDSYRFSARGYLSSSWRRLTDGSYAWQRLAEPRLVYEAPFLDARLGGVLHGRAIAVDPAGGGDDALDPTDVGIRGSELTLGVGALVAGLLVEAGARVELVRAGDATVPDLARIQASERFGSERYVRIDLAPVTSPRTLHFPGSSAGEALAARISARLNRVDGVDAGSWQTAPAVTPHLQQTSCPAVIVRIPLPPLGDFQQGVGDVTWRRRAARAIVLALAEDHGYTGNAAVHLVGNGPIVVDDVFVEHAGARLDGLEPAPALHRFESLEDGTTIHAALEAGVEHRADFTQ